MSYWIAEMQTARVSDGLPVPRASSPVPPITMPEPTTAEEEQAQELIREVFNQRVCEAKALAGRSNLDASVNDLYTNNIADEDRFNEVNALAYQGLGTCARCHFLPHRTNGGFQRRNTPMHSGFLCPMPKSTDISS